MSESTPEFALREVRRTFHRRRGRGAGTVAAVDGVDLDVMAGQRLGIVGESGSGKSTLLRMMAAIVAPTSGRISFRGHRIDSARPRDLGALRSSVQMVFQDPNSSLDPRMKVADIVTEPLRSPLVRGRGDAPADRRARLVEVLAEAELEPDIARRYPHELSGGQRQRVAIARALAPEPDVLLADEPVSALDVSVRAHVLNLFVDLVRARGLTFVLVGHDLAVVRHVCDSVAVMQAGRVVESGPVEQVYRNPRHDYTKTLLASVPSIRAHRG
ncbi:Oligopeptide/dipeptide transporter, C-terminal region [Propionibacterium cyclohexanicum]|uniref:Oligopeptide/dipeptide transporter, C-terminal region n=1 Tax=Propionibacterium cyclohexanicum TaxID=64702 RepID=A0A1H9QY99_9ACTN|nr:ATP-binding cassette domain-containing protein [Propionibacterium cyclohexanicum]SER65571.1 Oligopeptide/dipeptide transporter, C-terminal region [Propionibacterium cyclohexanicum]